MAMRDALRRAGFDVGENQEEETMARAPRDRRQDRGGRDRRPDQGAPPRFPDSYFGKDERGDDYLLPVFVSTEVDELAKRFANGNPRLTTGQLRRFFNHCREIERRLRVEDRSWEQVSAEFVKLRSHAQNAEARRLIPRDFQQFIDRNVDRVTASENPRSAFLDGFIQHFEALVGFGSAYMRDR
ncbi:MAG: type III-A CRISPR-associated protein Csm2 [Chloroflexi bacterium]|nr:type III-A CRISPR-associated protein Csm2 [Chloroflexota bacterium]